MRQRSHSRRRRQRGTAALETAIVSIPMIFVLLGTVEVARCMWMYHTLASATKTAARYAAVHGEACVSLNPACAATVGTVSGVLRRSAIGLDGSRVTLQFTAGGASTQCASLTACEALATAWPPTPYNVAGQRITIHADYSFASVLRAFWPGQSEGTVPLHAQSTEAIQF